MERNLHGGIQIFRPDLAVPSRAGWADLHMAVYRFEYEPADSEGLCEGCGIARYDTEHMYTAYAIHKIDGFGDSCSYCQACLEPTCFSKDPSILTYSTIYGQPTTWPSFESSVLLVPPPTDEEITSWYERPGG